MLDRLTALTGRAALLQYGIDVVDVRIKRLNLPEQNKQSVYAGMRAERDRIERQYRADGEEQALSIRADADRQKKEMSSPTVNAIRAIRRGRLIFQRFSYVMWKAASSSIKVPERAVNVLALLSVSL